MTRTVQKITLSPSRDIPFNKLVLSQSNVRRIKACVSVEQLAESIVQRTLLQSLNVRAVVSAEGNETGMFEVPAGVLDDGEIEQRVRLLRPMESHHVSLSAMAESHWLATDRDRFSIAWQAELAEVPEFAERTIHVVAGLLLPIWKRLPNESTRVYRLQTDAGERIIGRKVSSAWVASTIPGERPILTPGDAFAALLDGRAVLDLAEGLKLRRVRVMAAHRIELSGFTDGMRDRLRAYGLFAEIISWKLRMFVPIDAGGVGVLARVLERYPVERIGEREAV